MGKACDKCCGATDVPLKACAGCRVVWYCGPQCQKKDWKERGENKHKIQCHRNKEQMHMELYKETKKEQANEIDGKWQAQKLKEALEQGDEDVKKRLLEVG